MASRMSWASVRFRRCLIFSTLGLAAFLGFLGFTKIGINPDLTGIAPGNREYYREQLEFLKTKLVSNVLTVAVYTKGDLEKAKEVLKELKREFENSGHILETLRFDTPEIFIKYGIFSLKPGGVNEIMERFRNLRFLEQSIIDFRFWRNIGSIFGTVIGYLEDYASRKGFNEYILVSPDGEMIIMSFSLKAPVTNVGAVVNAVEDLMNIRDRLEKKYGLKIAFTGGPMATYESNHQVKKDFTITTIFSIVSISLVLYLTLGNAVMVGYLFLSMIVAMSISLGVFYLLFREINIVTSFVNAMILGLGIDYGIHLATRVSDKISRGFEKDTAIIEGFKETFLPSLISALTTTSAFSTLAFVKSPVFVQMGVMSSVGIWIFFVIMMTFFPALMYESRGRYKVVRSYDNFMRLMDYLRRDTRIPWILLLLTLVSSYFGFLNVFNYWYTPPGLTDETSESSRTYIDIKSKFENFGLGDVIIAVDDIKDLEPVSKDLEKSGYFSKVTSLVNLIGSISKVKAEEVLGLYGSLVKVVNDPILSAIFRKVGMYQQIIEMLRVVRESKDFSAVMNEIEKDLPMFFYNTDHKRYILIYASSKYDLYVNNNIKLVFDYLTKKGYKVFGYPALFYSVMKDTRSYIWNASMLISITIFLIILISIRSLSISILMLILVMASAISTFGIVRIWGIHASFMTLTIVPILAGIGIDGMIHMFHTVSRGSRGILRTEKAVSLSTITTVLAFGSFMVAKGQLLREFGISVSVGLISCFIMAMFVFLPVIEKRSLKEKEGD